MENRPLYKKLLGDYIDLHQEISVYDAKFRLARKLQEMTESGSPGLRELPEDPDCRG